jgi:hypothetical protein
MAKLRLGSVPPEPLRLPELVEPDVLLDELLLELVVWPLLLELLLAAELELLALLLLEPPVHDSPQMEATSPTHDESQLSSQQ